MQVLWGPVIGTNKWRVKVGAREIECKDAADAFLTAQRQGFRRDRLIRVQFPAPKVMAPVGPDLSVLDGSAKDVIAALKSGAHDAHLDELHEAEIAGKDRRSVVRVIEDRDG